MVGGKTLDDGSKGDWGKSYDLYPLLQLLLLVFSTPEHWVRRTSTLSTHALQITYDDKVSYNADRFTDEKLHIQHMFARWTIHVTNETMDKSDRFKMSTKTLMESMTVPLWKYT